MENVQEIWKRSGGMAKAKAGLLLISSALIVFASEAIHVAIVAAQTGITPLVFGIMPTRTLAIQDSVIIILISLFGIVWVGYRLIRTIFEGFPFSITESIAEPAGYTATWDGLLKPVRSFPYPVIAEIDTIARGTLGGGGHQIRFRVKGRRIALTVARVDTSLEADRLVLQLKKNWISALGLDDDIRKD